MKYPFDIGFYRNICSVMGDNPLLWLWPQQARGDGLSFPVRSNTGKEKDIKSSIFFLFFL